MKPLLISLAICISLPVLSQSGWTWQNPLPTGNLLYEIQFTDKTHGWAVGYYGTILYTDDQGVTWQKQENPNKNILFDVYFLSSTKGWAVGEKGTILHWNGTVWTEQNSEFEGQLKGVHFVNSNTGWAVGQGEAVLKTTNGGEKWTRMTFEGSQAYFSVHFLDEKKGYLCGAAGSNGVIKSSIDGGDTWQLEIVPAHRMNDIFMADTYIGWAVGDDGAVFHKADADSDWKIQMQDSTQNDLTSVSAINPHQAWIAGDGGSIYHTNDDGANWYEQESPDTRDLNSIQIFDGETGFAAGDGGALFTTGNAGGKWESMGILGPYGRLHDIAFMYPEWGLVTGSDGLIYSTLDQGETWTYDTSHTSNSLYAVDISPHGISYDRAIAVGRSGTVLRRWWESYLTDLPWEEQTFNHNEDLFDVDVRGRTVWATGHWATVARSLNSGIDWKIVHHSNQYHLEGIQFPSPNYGWAVGMSSKIIHTKDKGITWDEQTSPVSTNFKSVCFCDIYSGWAVGLNGKVIHTSDGGRNWVEQQSGIWESLFSVHFTDCNNGWIVGDGGTILHTSDGGEYWGAQESGTQNTLFTVYFADPLHGWICGDNGTILYTEDGGGPYYHVTTSRMNINKAILDDLETVDTLVFVKESRVKSSLETDKFTYIEVIIDSLVHPQVSDLELVLSHAGISDTLVCRNAEGENFIDLKLTDAGEMPVDSGAAPYSSTYLPCQSLSAFLDTDPEGPWILSIYDAATGNTGILEGWSLNFYFEEADIGSFVDPIKAPEPTGVVLEQNYPNPFRDQTYIKYHLPERVAIEIDIYNFLGQHVATLLKQEQAAGDYQISWKASAFESGIYFLQLRTGNTLQIQKMVLMR